MKTWQINVTVVDEEDGGSKVFRHDVTDTAYNVATIHTATLVRSVQNWMTKDEGRGYEIVAVTFHTYDK